MYDSKDNWRSVNYPRYCILPQGDNSSCICDRFELTVAFFTVAVVDLLCGWHRADQLPSFWGTELPDLVEEVFLSL